MQNATEIYRKLELSTKFSPGNFVRNKSIKNKLIEGDFEKKDNEYYFNDKTYEMYLSWADTKEEVSNEEEITSSTNEIFLKLCDKIGETNAIDYINKLMKWFILDQTYHTLSLSLETDRPLKYVTGNLNKILTIYLQVIYSHADLSGGLHRNEIRNLCNDLHKTFNSLWISKFHNNICFQVGKTIWQTNNLNKLKKVIKD